MKLPEKETSILFTLVIFLFSTVLLNASISFPFYHIIIRVVVYKLWEYISKSSRFHSTHTSFEATLLCFNHFPIFAPLLRLKEPAHLPGILILFIYQDVLLICPISYLSSGDIRFESLNIHQHTHFTVPHKSSPLVSVRLPISSYITFALYFRA